MGGTVAGDGARPPELVVGVNGTVAGTIGGYLPEGGGGVSGYIAPFFIDGATRWSLRGRSGASGAPSPPRERG